jgi:ribosomal protein S14
MANKGAVLGLIKYGSLVKLRNHCNSTPLNSQIISSINICHPFRESYPLNILFSISALSMDI